MFPVTKGNTHIFLSYIFRTDYSTDICELITVLMQTRTNHHISIDVHFRKLLKSFLSCYLTPKTTTPVSDMLVMTTLPEFEISETIINKKKSLLNILISKLRDIGKFLLLEEHISNNTFKFGFKLSFKLYSINNPQLLRLLVFI